MGQFESTVLSAGYSRLDILSHVLTEAVAKASGLGRRFRYVGRDTFSFNCMGDNKWGTAQNFVRDDVVPLISHNGMHWNFDVISPAYGEGRTPEESNTILRKYIKQVVDNTNSEFTVGRILMYDDEHLKQKYQGGEGLPKPEAVWPNYPPYANHIQNLEKELMTWMREERIKRRPLQEFFAIFNLGKREKWEPPIGRNWSTTPTLGAFANAVRAIVKYGGVKPVQGAQKAANWANKRISGKANMVT